MMSRLLTILKRIFVGRPVSSYADLHHRVPKRIALAVFSSDALSSSAYATDAMMLALVVAGTAALSLAVPISLAVVAVLAVVIVSYRTTVFAYPNGGGGYAVAMDNLGAGAGVSVASALLIDYVLTVAVSVSAGVKAIAAAVPELGDRLVPMAIGFVLLITLGNLRGLKESGGFFAIPTYGFLLSMAAMIVIGGYRALTGDVEPIRHEQIPAEAGLTTFLILRAFSQGATALTGVEAIANTVPAFKPPESKNAASTLITLGILLAFLFGGVSYLAHAYSADPHLIESASPKPIPAQLAAAIFGAGSVFFYVIQFMTATILFLAANTAYTGFPALASVLARDRFLPRVLQNRGDKLAYSNGILLLALAAIAVLVNYGAQEQRIIPLYVIGVFANFTIAQGGLVIRWLRIKGPRWKRGLTLNAVGGLTTFVVLIIVSVTKFKAGAWQVILLIPILALMLYGVRRHYQKVESYLVLEDAPARIESTRVLLLVSPYFGATIKALGFAQALAPEELHVVAFRLPESQLASIRRKWRDYAIGSQIEATGHHIDDLLEYVRGLEPTSARPVTLILPDTQTPNPIRQLLRGRLLLRIKGAFLDEPGVVVASVPFRPESEPDPDRVRAPARMSMVVVVSAVNRALLRAIDYARSLNPAELKAVTISLDQGESDKLIRAWGEAGIDVPLEVVDSPYRGIIQPLIHEVRSLSPNPRDAVAVVVPEFVVSKWWHHLLHGQTALMIKTALLFEPNVVVIDVPYPIITTAPSKKEPAANDGQRV